MENEGQQFPVKTERVMTLWYITVPKFLHINDRNQDGYIVGAKGDLLFPTKTHTKKNQLCNRGILGRFVDVWTK